MDGYITDQNTERKESGGGVGRKREGGVGPWRGGSGSGGAENPGKNIRLRFLAACSLYTLVFSQATTVLLVSADFLLRSCTRISP